MKRLAPALLLAVLGVVLLCLGASQKATSQMGAPASDMTLPFSDLEGKLRLTIGSESHVLQPGNSCHSAAATPHHCEASGDNEVTVLCQIDRSLDRWTPSRMAYGFGEPEHRDGDGSWPRTVEAIGGCEEGAA